MKDSFEDYKKVLDHNLVNVGFLYSGDVKSFIISEYKEKKNDHNISPIIIINSLIEIYNKSFENMISKSSEIVLPLEYIQVESFLKDISAKYIFCSKNGQNFLGSFAYKIVHETKNRPLPDYFYVSKYLFNNSHISYSPLIEDERENIILYVTDSAIQGLVYSIQNMEYTVEKINGDYIHKINYQLFDCDFKSYKICLKDVSRMRHDKINQILNDI